MNFSIRHADKEQLKELFPELFEILYSNMATAYPQVAPRKKITGFGVNTFRNPWKTPPENWF